MKDDLEKMEVKNGHHFWHSLFCQDCGTDIRESETKECKPLKIRVEAV